MAFEYECPKDGCTVTALSMSSRDLAESRLEYHIERSHPEEADSLKERTFRRPTMSFERERSLF